MMSSRQAVIVRTLGVLIILGILMALVSMPAAASPPGNNSKECKFLKEKICLITDEIWLAKCGLMKCGISDKTKDALWDVVQIKSDILCDFKQLLRCKNGGPTYNPPISSKCMDAVREIAWLDGEEFEIELLCELILIEIQDIKILKCAERTICDPEIRCLIKKTICAEVGLLKAKKWALCSVLNDLDF